MLHFPLPQLSWHHGYVKAALLTSLRKQIRVIKLLFKPFCQVTSVCNIVTKENQPHLGPKKRFLIQDEPLRRNQGKSWYKECSGSQSYNDKLLSITKMLFSFFFAAVIGSSLAQKTFNCASFWPVEPGTATTIDDQCLFFPGYPQVIGQVKVTVVYTQDWGKATAVNNGIIASTLLDSLTESITVYGTFTQLPPQIVIILTTEDEYPYSAQTSFPLEKTPPCQIQTLQRLTDNLLNDQPRASQVLAHEIYHCITDYAIGEVDDGWMIEGSANYFSNVVFPYSNVEWPGPEYNYDPTVPIYGQVGRNVYPTSLFFQAQEDTMGYYNIHDWVLTYGQGESIDATIELEHLSGIPGMIDLFYTFAKQFTLKQIQDTSGVYIPGLLDVNPSTAVVIPNDSGTAGTASLLTTPFTITTFQINLAPGQTVLLTTNANENQRVAYQQIGDTYWSDMPSDQGFGSEGFSVLPCNDGGQVSITVLFVSSVDVDDTVQIAIDQQDTDPTCTCQQPQNNQQRRGLQRRGLVECTNQKSTSTASVSASITSVTSESSITSGTSETSPTSDVSTTSGTSLTSISTFTTVTTVSTKSSTQSSNTATSPSATATGSCQSTSINTDPCLMGKTWTLNLPDLESVMNSELSTFGPYVTNIELAGSGQLTVSGNDASFSYSNFVVTIDQSIDGLDMTTTTTIDGNFQAYIHIQSGGSGSGTFCMDEYAGEGTITVTELNSPGFTISLSPDAGAISQQLIMAYTCSGNTLQMAGTLNGVRDLGPYVYTS
jgi:hypothetical protein